jgi:fatty acid desaturase
MMSLQTLDRLFLILTLILVLLAVPQPNLHHMVLVGVVMLPIWLIAHLILDEIHYEQAEQTRERRQEHRV